MFHSSDLHPRPPLSSPALSSPTISAPPYHEAVLLAALSVLPVCLSVRLSHVGS